MIDFFASATIALIIVMTLVIFLSNQHQAKVLKQMRKVMEDWYGAQMRDRRNEYQEELVMPDALAWVGEQVKMTIVETRRQFDTPPALECMTAEGNRIIISPLKKSKLMSELRDIERKRKKVSKLVEPLLGYRPGKIKMVKRNNETVHEWYEVEIEAALEKLNIDWGMLDELYFYVVPVEADKEKNPFISFDLQHFQIWIKKSFYKVSSWLKQQFEKASG